MKTLLREAGLSRVQPKAMACARMPNAFNRFRYRLHDRATARWSEPIRTPGRRLSAWASMMLADHGFIRLFHPNRHRITPRMVRSAQPAPHDLKWARAAGIRTIINLRGGTIYGSTALEREACARLGLAYEIFVIYSRAAPSRAQIHGLAALYQRVEKPVLIHCKSGSDRAGLAATLWMIFVEGQSVAEASKQLSLRFGHVRQGKTGILDAFFESYLADNAREPIEFLQWVDTVYDPDALERSFHAGFWGNLLVDKIFRRE
jgi:protein tyrosine/serine phosphatase